MFRWRHRLSRIHFTRPRPASIALWLILGLMALSSAAVSALDENTYWPTFANNHARTGRSLSTMSPPLNRIWKSATTYPTQHAGAVVEGGKLFSATQDGYLRAYNWANGALIWSRHLGSSTYGTSVPVVHEGGVFVTFRFPTPLLYKIDADTGNTLWTVGPSTPIAPEVWNVMAAGADRVFVSTSDYRVAAIDTNDGSLLWTTSPFARSWAGASLGDGINSIVIGTEDARVIKLEGWNGSTDWSTTLDDGVFMAPLIFRPSGSSIDTIIVATRAGTIYSLNGLTGAVQWQVGSFGPLFYTTPAYDGTNIYFGASATAGFVALNATTGATVWQNTTVFPSESSVAYANGYVYGTTGNGTLVTLSASTGAVVDTDALDVTGGSSNPAVFNGWVWVQDNQGALYGFQGSITDSDGDGDSNGTDCQPTNPAINHFAFDFCNGIDEDCTLGPDQWYPDGDLDQVADCVDTAPDVTGEQVVSGTITEGNYTELNSNDPYFDFKEKLQETGTNKKKLEMIYTVDWVPINESYVLSFEGQRTTQPGNDASFDFYAVVPPVGVTTCSSSLDFGAPRFSISEKNNYDSYLSATIGNVGYGLVCIKVKDSNQGNDTVADVLWLDRLSLYMLNHCTDADSDAYTPSCAQFCGNPYCPTTDCNDNDATISPGIEERPGNNNCSDGKDNNCNGLTDAADPGCTLALTTAAADACSGSSCTGRLISGSYASTTSSNNGYEVFEEEKINGISTLRRKWRFDNVPTTSQFHVLHYEGNRPANTDGDDFEFWVSHDDISYTKINGAIINSTTDVSGGVDSQIFQESSSTIYIMLMDTAGGATNDRVNVDHLVIKTNL